MAKKSQTGLLNKISKSTKGAWNKARKVKPQAKGMLPGGITGGVAQLVGYKLDESKEGSPYISLQGVVFEPDTASGKKATKTYYFEETKFKTAEEKLAEFSNDLQLLGCEMPEDFGDIVDVLEELVSEKPFYRFDTLAWNFGEKSGVSIMIQGLESDYEPDVEYEEEEDDEEEEEAPFEDEEEEEEDEDSEEEEESEEEDEGNDEEEEEEEYWEPAKGEVYNYKASAKSKLAECEVTSVNKTKETVSLERCSDQKVFKNVPWDKLED